MIVSPLCIENTLICKYFYHIRNSIIKIDRFYTIPDFEHQKSQIIQQ